MDLRLLSLEAKFRRYILAMMQAAISLQMTRVKKEGLTSMMKKVIIMIINYIKRYAENINITNDICDFSELEVDLNGISAISWECPNYYRREFGAKLLKDILTVATDGDFSCSHTMLQLTP